MDIQTTHHREKGFFEVKLNQSEEIKENLKRPRTESPEIDKKMNRKPLKTLFPIGGNQEFQILNISEKNSFEKLNIDETIIQYKQSGLELIKQSSSIFNKLEKIYEKFDFNYSNAQLAVYKQLGIQINTPTIEEINQLEEENQKLNFYLNELEEELERLKIEDTFLTEKNEKEEHELKEELETIKNNMEKRVQILEYEFEELEYACNLYSKMLCVEIELDSKTKFLCKAEIKDKFIEFSVNLANRSFEYEPLSTNITENSMVLHPIPDLYRQELPIHYYRLLKAVLPNIPN